MKILRLFNPFFRWWLRSGRYPWSRFRRKYFESKYLDTTLPEVHSVEEIRDNLSEVTWTMDGPLHLFDAISYPQTVWNRKKDDCDGFSILAASLLGQWNPETKPILLTVLMWPMRKSHTVCVFNMPGQGLCYFDNYSLRQGDFGSYAEIAARVKVDNELICWDTVDPETLETIEFHETL
jgi:hypothetical protein